MRYYTTPLYIEIYYPQYVSWVPSYNLRMQACCTAGQFNYSFPGRLELDAVVLAAPTAAAGGGGGGCGRRSGGAHHVEVEEEDLRVSLGGAASDGGDDAVLPARRHGGHRGAVGLLGKEEPESGKEK